MIPLILGPSLNRTWILLDFKINRDFIAEVFCINKDVPEEMCNGGSYLTDQLEKNEEREQSPATSTRNLEITFFIENMAGARPFQFASFTTHFFYCTRVFFSSNYLGEVFHPPQMA